MFFGSSHRLQHYVVLILLLCMFSLACFCSTEIKFVLAVSLQVQMPQRILVWRCAALLTRCVLATTTRQPSVPITSSQLTGRNQWHSKKYYFVVCNIALTFLFLIVCLTNINIFPPSSTFFHDYSFLACGKFAKVKDRPIKRNITVTIN